MNWNYRIVKRHYPEFDETIFAIHEVYYGEDGNPEFRTLNPVSVECESEKEMRDVLDMMKEALYKPVLHWRNDFPGDE